MSPRFINTNEHYIYPVLEPGYKQAPGAEFDADGDAADVFKNTAGVVLADSAEAKAYRDAHQVSESSEGPTRAEGVLAVVQEAALQSQAVSAASNSLVIGDDEAPHGPPSGTITTKVIEAEQGGYDRQAFAPGEALPGDEDKVGTGEAHSQQAVQQGRTDAVARQMAGGADTEGRSKDDLQVEADALGLDVKGTGAGGSVTKADLRKALDKNRAG